MVRENLRFTRPWKPYQIESESVPILLFAARAGSTYAGQLLANHPDMGRMAEWFNPARLHRIRDEHDFADHREAVQYILDHEAKKVFGFECTLIGLISCTLLGFLDQLMPRTYFILLKRRDRVAHAVSLTKAQLSGQYSSNQQPKRTVTINDYDREKIAHNYRIVEGVYEKLEAFLARISAPSLEFFYEDIVENPASFQSSVYANLGLDKRSNIALGTSVKKIGDDVNSAWISRYNQEMTASS